MKFAPFALQLFAVTKLSSAFTIRSQPVSVVRHHNDRRFMSQWDEEEEPKNISFSDAKAAMDKEEDEANLEGMGDFDANPAVRAVARNMSSTTTV